MDPDMSTTSIKDLAPPVPDDPPPKPQTIFLHILSPSSEVPDKLTFPAIPVTTTVDELKNKIQDAITTKPSPQRQRLIYRGKALVKPTDTMKDVFGQDTIDDPVAHSLHLVLPPSNITPFSAPASGTASNIPSTTPSQNPHIPPGGASQEQLLSSAQNHRDSSQSPTPNVAIGGLQSRHLPIHNGHNGLAHAHGHVPPHIQAAMNNHFAALSQQLGQQLAIGALAPPTMPPRPVQSNHLHHFSTSAQPSFQQVITQQQQARATAGRQGVADVPIVDPSRTQTPTPNHATPTLQPTSSDNSDSLAPEIPGPNTNNWRISVNESTITLPTVHAGYGATAGTNTGSSTPVGVQGTFIDPANAVALSAVGQPGAAIESNPSAFFSQPFDLETHGRGRVQQNDSIQQGILNLERMLAGGLVPSQDQINALRSQISEIGRHRNALSQGLESMLHTRLSNISRRASHMGRNSGGDATASANVTQVASMPDRATPMVYLLSSPSGPHALLVSPLGLYGTNPRTIPFRNDSAPHTTNFQQRHRTRPQAFNGVEDLRGHQQAGQRPPNPAQAVAQDQAQVHDLARILLPFGGHLWLFVRLFGFVYFFTPGGGWRRAAVFAASALVVLFLQSQFFRPIYRAIWEPFRRHVEGLMPLADDGRRDVGGVQGAVANNGGNGVQAGAGHIPDVRQAAERLLREREQRRFAVIRQYLRSFERAVAIFFASLVPGIGERHVAARDAAEAVRLVEQLETEGVGARREEGAEGPGVGDPSRGERTTDTAPDERNEEDRRVMHDQPPVVEI